MDMSDVRVVMLGVPGAGKGTQARRLATRLGLQHITTSDVIRETLPTLDVAKQQEYKETIDRGEILPSDVVAQWVADRAQRALDAGQGLVLDGSPRRLQEAEELATSGLDWSTFRVILLQISDDEAIRRMEQRRECVRCRASVPGLSEEEKISKCGHCGGALASRENETPEVIRHRLEVFHAETEPLVDYFEQLGVLTRVDGSPSIEDVEKSVLAVFGVSP